MVNVYEVEEISLGDKQEKNRIVFKSVSDMEKAYKDIDNGSAIYVVKDGLVTKILNQMVTSGVYEGKIQLCAKQKQGEKIGDDLK